MPTLDAHFGGEVLAVPTHGGLLAIESIGRGPPVILVHGWTLDRRVWGPQIAALSEQYRVIAYDRRGHGQSTAPSDVADEPDDVARVAHACGIDRYAIVGMALGGRIALAHARRAPEVLSALVLHGAAVSDAPFGIEHDGMNSDPALRDLARSGALDRVRAVWTRHALMTLRSSGGHDVRNAIDAEPDMPEIIASLIIGDDALSGVTAPVLLITGEQDSASRRRAAAELAAHAGGQVAWEFLPGAGHLANLANPQRYNRILIDFLRRAHAPPAEADRAARPA